MSETCRLPLVVNIAQGYDIRAVSGMGGNITAPHSSSANSGHVDSFARWNVSSTAKHVARNDSKPQSHPARRGQEGSP